jgi:hypothetical protein
MKKRLFRIIVVVSLGSLIALSVIQMVGYRRLAPDQISAIALELTPEHTHLKEGTTLLWVWLRTDRCENLTERQQSQLQTLLRKRYNAVYVAQESIPADKVRCDQDGPAYQDGFEFEFSVVSRGFFWVRVRHHDFEAREGSSRSGQCVYAWILGAWVKVYDAGMIVS